MRVKVNVENLTLVQERAAQRVRAPREAPGRAGTTGAAGAVPGGRPAGGGLPGEAVADAAAPAPGVGAGGLGEGVDAAAARCADAALGEAGASPAHVGAPTLLPDAARRSPEPPGSGAGAGPGCSKAPVDEGLAVGEGVAVARSHGLPSRKGRGLKAFGLIFAAALVMVTAIFAWSILVEGAGLVFRLSSPSAPGGLSTVFEWDGLFAGEDDDPYDAYVPPTDEEWDAYDLYRRSDYQLAHVFQPCWAETGATGSTSFQHLDFKCRLTPEEREACDLAYEKWYLEWIFENRDTSPDLATAAEWLADPNRKPGLAQAPSADSPGEARQGLSGLDK